MWWKNRGGAFEVVGFKDKGPYIEIFGHGFSCRVGNDIDLIPKIKKRLEMCIIYDVKIMNERVLLDDRFDNPEFDPVYEVVYGN